MLHHGPDFEEETVQKNSSRLHVIIHYYVRRWYLGEVGEEVSTEILRNCHRDNVFVVHKSPSTNNYMLSVR